MDPNRINDESHLEKVTGGNSWNEYWGEEGVPSYYEYYCEVCGYVEYRIPTSKEKSEEKGLYHCSGCNRDTPHSWRTVSLR